MVINTITAKDGAIIAEIVKGEKTYRLNSMYNPHAEAEKYAAKLAEEDCRVLIVFGCGIGIFPEEIIKACGDKIIIFYEPCIEMEEFVQECIERESILLNNNVFVLSNGVQNGTDKHCPISDFPKVLDEVIDYTNYKSIKYAALPQYHYIFPDEYSEFEKAILYKIRRVNSNVLTAKDMGKEAVINNILNVLYVSDGYCADSFVGIFPEGLPAIIVAAGPSLDKNVHILKDMKGRAFIICVDTAAEYLVQRDIIPDMIVCVDAMKPLYMFDDDRILNIPIVVSSDVNYKVLERMKDSSIIFASTENPYIQALYNISNHSISKLKSGGSVATMAFSLCIYWGFKHIVFVGQDLALADDKMYAGDIDNPLVQNLTARKLIEVEGINGDIVYTYQDYYSYLLWFEQEIAMHSQIEVIDATEGGAKIHGSKTMRLQDVRDICCDGFEFNVGRMIEMVLPAFDTEQKQELMQRVHQSLDDLYLLRDRLYEGVSAAKRAEELSMDEKNSWKCTKLESVMRDINEFYNSLNENFLIQRIIDATELEYFMTLFEASNEISRTERYSRMRSYYECILRALNIVLEEWDKLCISLS